MACSWLPGDVGGMLDKAGASDTRPDFLQEDFGLIDGEYRLSPVQAQAILDLRLHRLTGLEQDKITKEYKELLDKIKVFSVILTDPDELLKVIQDLGHLLLVVLHRWLAVPIQMLLTTTQMLKSMMAAVKMDAIIQVTGVLHAQCIYKIMGTHAQR